MLDLIPWGPSPPPHYECTFDDLNPHIWSCLPDNLLHSVLARLPFQSVLRFRCVCKQWKALFASPTFHHFASHRARVPPFIFFIGSSTSHHADHENSDAINRYHDGFVHEDDKDLADYDLDDMGFDYSISDDNDGDSHCDDNGSDDSISDDSDGDSHRDDHFMEGDEDEDIHDVMRYVEHAKVPDVMDPWGMHDVIGNGDHGVIYDVDVKDNNYNNGLANDQEAPKEHPEIENLLLIFDCESESWRRPLALPSGFRMIRHPIIITSYLNPHHVCTFQEQLLVPSWSSNRLFLFNPASPPCKELPPCIAIQNLRAFGFVQERATLPGAVTWSNLNNLFSMSNEEQAHLQHKTAKVLQVVAIGNTINTNNIVESFDSVTGSWHVIGCLPQSYVFTFGQYRMVYCKGCFYALLEPGILMMSNVQVGQSMEWKYQAFPDPPNPNHRGLSSLETELIDWGLLATRESVFLVLVTIKWAADIHQQDDWDVLIWQFHPDAPADACWELHAYLPRRIQKRYVGDIRYTTMDHLAHGDLIFFKFRDRRHFLVYDVLQKMWRISAKCKYFLDRMIFLWEPLLGS